MSAPHIEPSAQNILSAFNRLWSRQTEMGWDEAHQSGSGAPQEPLVWTGAAWSNDRASAGGRFVLQALEQARLKYHCLDSEPMGSRDYLERQSHAFAALDFSWLFEVESYWAYRSTLRLTIGDPADIRECIAKKVRRTVTHALDAAGKALEEVDWAQHTGALDLDALVLEVLRNHPSFAERLARHDRDQIGEALEQSMTEPPRAAKKPRL